MPSEGEILIKRYIQFLGSSDRGQQAMRGLLIMLDNGAIGLDQNGQEALGGLLLAVHGPYRGTVFDLMRESVGRNSLSSSFTRIDVHAAAAAIANARGGRRGVPPIENVLAMLPEKLRDEVIEDATAALRAVLDKGGK